MSVLQILAPNKAGEDKMNAILRDEELSRIKIRSDQSSYCTESIKNVIQNDVPRLLAMIQQLQDELNMQTFKNGRHP